MFIFISFVLFVIGLNTATFLAGFNPRQIVNVFYLSERTVAIALLLEHIVFESGVILHNPDDEEIRQAVWEECSGTSVDPELVMRIINGYKKRGLFCIDYDGSMGLLRVKSYMLRDMMGVSPFVLRDNIKMGVTYLSMLMEKDPRLDIILCEYLKPASSRTLFEKDIQAANRQAMKIYSEYINTKPQSEPRYAPDTGEIIPFISHL
ncbi:MAG: hypothetical protein LBH05_02725 [Deferribacteraceae bacterium]|nr:hypothetical protein [Deferribacteraceae bacterium]